MLLNPDEIKFCAEQCWRQKSGELSVANMCIAYYAALNADYLSHNHGIELITVEFVERLGKLVDPVANSTGFRKQPITIGNTIVPVADFNRQLSLLLESDLTPEEKYQEFERIHPFNDGNGRVGAILYNVWKRTMIDYQPINPPEFVKSK